MPFYGLDPSLAPGALGLDNQTVDPFALTGEELQQVRSKGRARALKGTSTSLSDSAFSPVAFPQELSNKRASLEAEAQGLQAPPDYSGVQAYQKARGGDSGRMLSLALAASTAGEEFKPLQSHFLSRALAAQEPMKVTGGVVSPEGQFVADPGYQRDQRLQFVQKRIDALDAKELEVLRTGATLAQQRALAEERIAAQRELRMLTAGMAGAAREDKAAAAEEKTRFAQVNALSKEYDARVKSFSEGAAAAQQVITLAANPNVGQDPQAQTAIVFAFGRSLDPTSVVREGEYKLFEQARGWLESIGITPERIAKGARLTPAQIQRMAGVAQQLISGAQERKKALQQYYVDKAARWKLDPQDVMPDYAPVAGPGGAPGAPGTPGNPLKVAPRPSAPGGQQSGTIKVDF